MTASRSLLCQGRKGSQRQYFSIQSQVLTGARKRPASSEMVLQVRITLSLLVSSMLSKDLDRHVEKDIFKPDPVQIIGISPDSVEKEKLTVYFLILYSLSF